MRFSLKAIDARQQLVSLTLEAASEAAAREDARQKGLQVFHVSCTALFRPRRVARFSAALFSVELMALLEAGLNLVEALQTLAEKEGAASRTGERHEVLAAIVAAIRRGEPFSHAVASMRRHFSPLYVATIQASERTGNVKEALGRYIAYQNELDRVKKKVVSASIYPAILAIVGCLVLGFLMFYVVPRFARVYDGMSATLPFFSSLLLGVGKTIETHGVAIAMLAASALVTGILFFSSEKGRNQFALLLWRIPAFGERLKIYQLARLYRTAGMLMRAGIPALQALGMVRDLLSAHLRPRLERVLALVAEGKPMSGAFGAAGLATPVATRMMLVGERSGDMGTMLGRIAAFHDDETARHIDWFTRAFEPLLMAALGISVGLVVVLMYMPIFELAGSIQ